METLLEVTEKLKNLTETSLDRAKDYGEIAKLSVLNRAKEETVNKLYAELGRRYYQTHGLAPEAGYEAVCDKITDLKAKIESNKNRITELKINAVVDDEVCEPDEVEG